MTTSESAYIPGVCKINRAETAQRRMIGNIGLAIFVIFLIGFLLLDVNRIVRIVLFLPAVLAASGYLQARNHFCVGYASAGKQNASQGSAVASDITEDSAKASDKKKARRMNLQSAAIALLATAVALLLPHL
jgi:hypothetical protein